MTVCMVMSLLSETIVVKALCRSFAEMEIAKLSVSFAIGNFHRTISPF